MFRITKLLWVGRAVESFAITVKLAVLANCDSCGSCGSDGLLGKHHGKNDNDNNKNRECKVNQEFDLKVSDLVMHLILHKCPCLDLKHNKPGEHWGIKS